MKHTIFLLSCLALLTTCIDRINLDETLSGEPLLVVDGLMTNADEPYRVILSYTSSSLKTYQGDTLSGAEVYITDEAGNRADLSEVGNGEYETNPSQFRGAVGNTYQLHIIAPDGKAYESLPETMPAVPSIDSLYFEVDSEPFETTTGTVLQDWGLRFYLNTGVGEDRAGYYRWSWQETYEFMAPFTRPAQLRTPVCYRSGTRARYLNIATTQDLSTDLIRRWEINFVKKSGLQLQRRYSLLVKQYALTERAYVFWENVRELQTDAGSVFAPPPSPIPGNVLSVSNSQEQVLGYFQVSSVTEKRVFVRRDEVPPSPGPSPGSTSGCVEGDPEAADYCYDCTLTFGATTEVPSFW